MHEKPKISHFASNDNGRSKKAHDKSTLDIKRTTLGELYPSPMSYDKKESSNSLRQRMYVRQLPRYPSLSIATYGSVVVGLTLIDFKNLGETWMGSEGGGYTMSTVFSSFFIAIIIFSFAYAWIKYVINTFYALGRSTQLFWIANIIILTIMIALDQIQTTFSSNIISTIVFAILYFASTFGISSILLGKLR